MLKNRRHKLSHIFDDEGLDALFLTDITSIRYLTGFTGSEAALLATRTDVYFLCDSRYTSQAANEAFDVRICEYKVRKDVAASLIRDNDLKRTGFDSHKLTHAEFLDLYDAVPGTDFVPLKKSLADIRKIKDSSEIDFIQQACSLASEAFTAVSGGFAAGMSEKEAAFAIEFEMRRLGADKCGFDIIAASGERGAMPHGRASGKIMARGELVTVDFGCSLHGYHSDETVTFSLGEPDLRQREIYDSVLAAHDLAIESIKPGMTCRDVDAVARDFIAARGYGDYFGHGLGHGIGLEVHEKPVISPRSNEILEEGMVFTVEPGIYIPGFGGVRIEDVVVVTGSGCSVITNVPKKLMILN